MAGASVPAADMLPTESAQAGPIPVESPRRRLETVDLLRGLLMVLMALDHTRDYFSSARNVDFTDPVASWPALYFTRWITHLCAPGFVALAGTSVYLQRQRGKTAGAMQSFLLKRGLWLIVMELTVVSFAWTFSFFPILQVIWAVGLSMMVLAPLQRLRPQAVGLLGAAIVVLHNLLDPVRVGSPEWRMDVWDVLHQQGMLMAHGRPIGFLVYPLLPWIGIICLGYWFGVLVNAAMDPARRRRRVAMLGAASLALYTLLRFASVYGDAFHLHNEHSVVRDLMSFFEVQKYPPSLQYVLATFGFLLLLYAAFDWLAAFSSVPRLRQVFETYGRVPFFYYVLHIYLLHFIAILLTAVRGGDWRFYFGVRSVLGEQPPFGYSLPAVYLIWIVAVALLYLPCLWFSRVKARRRDWWLSYL